jgi:transcriptional regulator with XRE-family HTH domain
MPKLELNQLFEIAKDTNRVLVPNILPNNIKDYRELKKLSVRQLAEDLLIDRNFLTAVEANDKNFSGKSTIRYLKHFGISYYYMYDVQGKRECDTIDECVYNCTGRFSITLDEIIQEYDIDKKMIRTGKKGKDLSVEEMVKYFTKKNNMLTNIIKAEGKNLGVVFREYEVTETKINNRIVNIDLLIRFTKAFELKDQEFDINFAAHQEREVSDWLFHMGYPETIATLDFEVDNEYVSVINNKVILDKEYKIPKSEKNLENYYMASEFDINDRDIDVKIDKESGRPMSVKFRSIRNEINNFKQFRTLQRMSLKEMHTSVGLSYNGYINLELGNQKISSKIMWRVCNKLKVPLEAIVNIDEYFERFCKHTKIEKKSGINKKF